MLPELSTLLQLTSTDAGLEDFRRLAEDEDALQKSSIANRHKTFSYLKRLYGLDPSLALFRNFRQMSALDPASTATLAAGLAMAREPILQQCLHMVLDHPVGSTLGREDFEDWIREAAPGCYSQTMYRSFSHNLYASFFQFGYLSDATGTTRMRRMPKVSVVTVAYAAFIDWLEGNNGLSLLGARYSSALQLDRVTQLDLLTAAGRQGLMRVAYAGGVLELDFSAWLKPSENRLTR